ncbi:MAG TPA: 30S ribosomal protein S7 [Tissierellia bacterium]|nr:30S ribosomal protein S7 [Tissierellia bacterium]
MPRKGSVPKRDVLPDPVYGSKVITKLINNVMLDGKKGVAQEIVYDALSKVEQNTDKNALEAFNQALDNIMPLVEVKARRVGGANYQVPIEVRPERRQTLGLRWLVSFARRRKERTMTDRLAAEITDAFNSTGGAVKRREEMHKSAEANKAFAHFRY